MRVRQYMARGPVEVILTGSWPEARLLGNMTYAEMIFCMVKKVVHVEGIGAEKDAAAAVELGAGLFVYASPPAADAWLAPYLFEFWRRPQAKQHESPTAEVHVEAGWWDQLVWNAAETLGSARAALVGAEDAAEVGEAPRSVEELVQRLRADYDRNYFLTGDVDAAVYTEDCEFADPFTSFRGRQRFVQNLKNLAGGFITNFKVKLLDFDSKPQAKAGAETSDVLVTSRLRVQLELALPWSPVLGWVWGVEHRCRGPQRRNLECDGERSRLPNSETSDLRRAILVGFAQMLWYNPELFLRATEERNCSAQLLEAWMQKISLVKRRQHRKVTLLALLQLFRLGCAQALPASVSPGLPHLLRAIAIQSKALLQGAARKPQRAPRPEAADSDGEEDAGKLEEVLEKLRTASAAADGSEDGSESEESDSEDFEPSSMVDFQAQRPSRLDSLDALELLRQSLRQAPAQQVDAWIGGLSIAILSETDVGNLQKQQFCQVFHVNEYRSGPYPIEMNTGDLIGDVFFALQLELMLPLVCPDPKWPYHDDCHNKEITSKDLVVSRLVLRVDPQWSAYAACNQGLPGNVDEYGNHCVEGTYCCFCGEPYFRRPRPCNGTLGRKNVKKDLHFAPAQWCNESARDYDCWQARLHEKLQWSDPGWWYSTAAAGYCPYHPQNCSWEVVALQKVINQTCHRETPMAELWRPTTAAALRRAGCGI
ncbi:unnamed protein product [Effrenium voratum]|nr:unnamed protein product [Effrenium voratum]